MEEEKKVLGPTDAPFVVGDGMLAFALYLAGVPFDDEANWCRNEYTREMLRDFGFNGLDMRQAAIAAVKAEKHGKVTFAFKQVPRLRALLKAYTEQEKQLHSSDGLAFEVFQGIVAADLEPDIKAIKLACVILKMRGMFMNGWKYLLPFIIMRGEGRVERSEFPFKDNSGRVRTGIKISRPGIKAFSANASDETLRKLEVL